MRDQTTYVVESNVLAGTRVSAWIYEGSYDIRDDAETEAAALMGHYAQVRVKQVTSTVVWTSEDL